MSNINKLIAYAVISVGAFGCTAVFAIADADINSAVQTQIQSNEITSASNIQVNTKDGVVSLAGNLQTENEADSAIQTANSVAGVKDVDTNKLLVRNSSQSYKDSYITAKIKGSFLREKIFGDQPIASLPINVETKNGVVFLTGTADSKTQLDTAIKVAKTIKGVRKVDSKVVVNQ